MDCSTIGMGSCPIDSLVNWRRKTVLLSTKPWHSMIKLRMTLANGNRDVKWVWIGFPCSSKIASECAWIRFLLLCQKAELTWACLQPLCELVRLAFSSCVLHVCHHEIREISKLGLIKCILQLNICCICRIHIVKRIKIHDPTG